jgi:cellobiose-specific phosphotransferase system component IIA
MKKNVIGVIVGLLLVAGVAFARPVKNVSNSKHPNLAQAQNLIQQAFDKLSAAQSANEFDMAGHAKKAKDLLDEANREIKEAALTANANK